MEIVKIPHPVLFQKAKPVEKIDKKILELIKEMKKTLLAAENPKGVGLAAPQVGKPLRIFLTKPWPKSEISVFINPELKDQSEELTSGVPERDNKQSFSSNKLEGCLSIPKIWGVVKRHERVTLKYQTPDGKTHVKTFSGFMATIIQHEMDHLDGHLFSSRTVEQKGQFYQIQKKEEGKEELVEIELT